MKCYLADLVYDTVGDHYVVPLNIGYLAAYLENKFNKLLEIKLFKYPEELEKELRIAPPDLLGVSNYSWNSRLGLTFLDIAKSINPQTVTVMGGPNIRLEPDDIKKFLQENSFLDYYIPLEGEEPLAALVEALLKGEEKPAPPGCATIINNIFFYQSCELKNNPKELDIPSPYLSGLLDSFLSNPKMIPLLETNRGCPFGCVYCVWGISALSKVRYRDINIVNDEIDYVSERSNGQLSWIFCDANFGILPRDVDIARRIREKRDKNGVPVNVVTWSSKNTTYRNIEISKYLENNLQNNAFIALQSADPKVLELSGRGNIKFEKLLQQVQDYKDRKLEIRTDLLVGLPGESYQSHIDTLIKSFELGFDTISINNIRLLPGSEYETDKFRDRYNIITKFRPIFGAYGRYDSRISVEIEESVRSTKDITEVEYNSLKVIHWLIYFTWNTGIFKPVLKLGQKYGINPGVVLNTVALTKTPELRKLFDNLLFESMEEWFETKEKMLEFYNKEENYHDLINNFMKLNSKYIALVYRDRNLLNALKKEIEFLLRGMLKNNNPALEKLEEMIKLSDLLFCHDLLQDEFRLNIRLSGEMAAIVTNDLSLEEKAFVNMHIYRPSEFVKTCRSHLKNNYSIRDFTWLIQDGLGGLGCLKNKISVAE